MEGGGAMEGRGSDVEYWRGETHLGSSLPISSRRFPCPRVISRVRASFPVSARRCLRPRVVALVPASLPVSARVVVVVLVVVVVVLVVMVVVVVRRVMGGCRHCRGGDVAHRWHVCVVAES